MKGKCSALLTILIALTLSEQTGRKWHQALLADYAPPARQESSLSRPTLLKYPNLDRTGRIDKTPSVTTRPAALTIPPQPMQ